MTGNDGTHKLDVVGRYGDDGRDVVAVIAVVAAILVGIKVDNDGSVDAYLRVLDAMRGEEALYLFLSIAEACVKIGKVIAKFL